MNEESGNMVWRGREIIGQIIAAQPALFREYASIMITAAVGEPVFYPTLMKAVQLLMAVDPKLIACRLDRLKELGMVI